MSAQGSSSLTEEFREASDRYVTALSALYSVLHIGKYILYLYLRHLMQMLGWPELDIWNEWCSAATGSPIHSNSYSPSYVRRSVAVCTFLSDRLESTNCIYAGQVCLFLPLPSSAFSISLDMEENLFGDEDVILTSRHRIANEPESPQYAHTRVKKRIIVCCDGWGLALSSHNRRYDFYLTNLW